MLNRFTFHRLRNVTVKGGCCAWRTRPYQRLVPALMRCEPDSAAFTLYRNY